LRQTTPWLGLSSQAHSAPEKTPGPIAHPGMGDAADDFFADGALFADGSVFARSL
jgi:hypothetical protein